MKKEDNIKKLNVYGLLQAALMTGDGIENILTYALSCYIYRIYTLQGFE